ncbi:tetratricopeptide repeat protein [Lujinxingia vulgaris]|uniref:Tetratricopeptide repeat protein n=1 Tax=Lujinxingia vulgaris TaxID=2600176 RepID=A0A5C6XD46_9DELT|nr:tetratricopeptide repeat protein [Lujinxingia vulgaris]TXD35317.1 tetratricopeptide repeat protein [Lujinxingia vulgaris]
MERYYVKRPTGKVFGPFDQNAIRLMLKGNKLGTDAQVSTDKESWTPISEVAAFADDAGNTTRAGLGVQDLPTSAGGPALPTPRNAPDLPRPKLSDLPRPKLGDLPKPKSDAADLPAPRSAPDLPRPKLSDLPRVAGSNLPKPAGSDLPTSAGSNLPTSAGNNLPTSAGGNLPTSAGNNLPTSANANLPTSADDDDLFAAPITDDDDLFAAPVGAGAAEDDDLFAAPVGAGAAEDDDLFAAPVGAGAAEDDDLFAAPMGAGANQADDDDLFAAPVSSNGPHSDDLFAAPMGAEPSDDLFGPAPGMDEDSDDLFAAPAPDEDPFAAPAADDDPFAAPAPEPDPFDQGDDLFEAPKLDDDSLFSDAPADEDDFLGGDQGFSFLDEEPEGDDWDSQLVGNDSFDADDLGVNEADWGDDMMGGPAPAAAAPPPRQPAAPSSRPQPQQAGAPAASGHDPFRPASTGIKDEQPASPGAPAAANVAKAVDADKKRGAMAAIGVPVLAVLVLGAAGFGIYTSFFAQEEVVQQAPAPTAPKITSLNPELVLQDNYASYLELFAQAEKGQLDPQSSALLLLGRSFYLTRYQDDAVAASAETLAESLAAESADPMVAAALAANEARLAQADAAEALAEPALTDPDAAYWAHLSAGVAYALASLDGQYEGAPTPAASEDATSEDAAPENAAPAEEQANAAEDETQEGEALAEANEEAGEEAQNDAESASDTARASLLERAERHLTAASKANEAAAAPHYWHARVLSGKDDNAAALEALERASNADPNHVATRLLAGKLYYEGGDLNDATEHLEKIISELSASASPAERGEAYHVMGMVHMARQQSDESIAMFTEALNIDSSRVDSLRALAEQYERAEMYQEALNFFTTNKNLGQQDPEVMLGIVRSHMGLEQYNEAILKLEEGEKEFPEDARFPFYLGRLNMQRGTFYEARRAFERAVEIDPSLLTAHAALAQLAWRIDNDVARGEEHVRAITERPEGIDAAIASQVANYYRLSERRELARQWNEEALRLDPNFWNARINLSRLLLEDGKSERALELLERARAEGIQDIRLSAYLADAYRQAGQFDRAIDEINKVIEAEPSNEEYIFIRGRIYFDRGNFETAREDFNKAYELNPRYHEAYFYVGRTALAEKDFNTAKRIFGHVLDYQPNNGEFHYFMGRTFEDEESETQALTQYQRATTVDPAYGVKNPEIYVRRGLLLARTGATRAGKADIMRALELKPDMVEARFALGEANFREQNYADAIEHYSGALEKSPERPLAQYQYGMALIYEGQREQGARHLQQAIRFGYDNPEIYRRLGYLYRELNQRAQAVESFKTYLRETANLTVPDATRREMLQQIEELGG